MCFFRKKREKKKALEAKRLQEEQFKHNLVEQPEDNYQEPIVGIKPFMEEVVVEQKEDHKVVIEQKPESKVVVEQKPEIKVVSPAKYHVSQNKDEDSEHFKKWRVRKAGSTKTIKFFETQKEAISFAEDLADKAGSSVVIHKLDGSIRKQDYAKKE